MKVGRWWVPMEAIPVEALTDWRRKIRRRLINLERRSGEVERMGSPDWDCGQLDAGDLKHNT